MDGAQACYLYFALSPLLVVKDSKIQTGLLKTEVGKGSTSTADGRGTRQWQRQRHQCGDIGAGPRRSFLFLLTAYDPGIGLSGEGV
ncbi:hypothetical protein METBISCDRAFT_9672, partial [Metschnikowia bicuspidata]